MKRMVGNGVAVLALGLGLGAPAIAYAGQHGSVGSGSVGSGSVGSGARAVPGYLGIDVRDVSDDEAPTLKLKDSHGAEIIRVDHDGPAGKMGLREHDVVVQMNGAIIV